MLRKRIITAICLLDVAFMVVIGVLDATGYIGRPLAINIFGWQGVLSLLGAYALISFKAIDQGGIYQILNLIGAGGLALTASQTKNYQSLVVQVFWMLIGVTALARRQTDPEG